MARTAFNALLDLARRAGPLMEGVATSGSTTTIVDTVRLGVTDFTADNELNGGTAFIISAGGEAPENETASITDYTASASTVTLKSGDLSASVQAGNHYGVTVVPVYQLFQAVNAALQDLGDLPQVDETVWTISGQREYTLPTAVAPEKLCQVWLQSSVARPYDWVRLFNWRVVPAASSYGLEFTSSLPSGYLLRLVYLAPHAMLDSDGDAISDVVPWDYLIWQSAGYLFQRRLLQSGVDREHWTGLMNHAFQMAGNALKARPIPYPQSQKLAVWEESVSAGITTEEIPTA